MVSDFAKTFRMNHKSYIFVSHHFTVDFEICLSFDFVSTYWAKSLLRIEDLSEYFPSFQTGTHFLVLSLFEISLPFGIKGISVTFNLPVSADFSVAGGNESCVNRFSVDHLASLSRNAEGPESGSDLVEVFLHHPSFSLLRMSAFNPFPEAEPYLVVYLSERR